MEDLLFNYNPHWESGKSGEGLIPREEIMHKLNSSLESRQIIFITGIRRVGKTSTLKLLMNILIQKYNVKPERIFYISLDDFLLGKSSLQSIIEEYRKIHKLRLREKIYLFLDEITYMEHYEQQLKNIYDSQNVKIYVSSSSSSVLRSKKPFLTGRSFIHEILPLDFEEYLKFKNIEIARNESYLREKYFLEYLRNGGLPEYVLHKDIRYLKELIDDIIYKDIASFHSIRDINLLKDFFLLLMERTGKIISINKIANILKISPDTASRYLKMFSDTSLIYLITRFGKTNERILSPKKLYSIDTGIRSYFSGFRDIGSIFENYVYLKIKNRNPFYISENGIEIDFYTEQKELIEVKYNDDLNEKQKKLFDNFPAEKKIIVRNIHDAKKLL